METSIVLSPQRERIWVCLSTLAKLNVNCLLQGPPGCGKSFFAHSLASSFNKTLVTVSLSATDPNEVAGFFTSTSTPGVFAFKHSALATALLNSDWILIEDLDSASTDTLAAVNALLSDPSYSSNSFIIATARVPPRFPSFHQKFASLTLPPLDLSSDLPKIASLIVPHLSSISPTLCKIAQDIYSFLISNLKPPKPPTFAQVIRESFVESLLKHIDLCLLPVLFFSVAPTNVLSQSLRKQSLTVALSSLSISNEGLVDRTVGTPIIKFSGVFEDELSIGAVPINSSLEGNVYYQNSSFVEAPSSLGVIEYLAGCVYHRNPVLLIGEAGVGKTFIVQHLASLCGKSLTVFNLSNQTESSDLMGSLRPSNPLSTIAPITSKFLELFKRTFSCTKNKPWLDDFTQSLSSKSPNLKLLISKSLQVTELAVSKLSSSNQPPSKKAQVDVI
ncbi:hypothetical protein GEMRC1_009432 [Eukaryota sp. GEM-RC1]